MNLSINRFIELEKMNDAIVNEKNALLVEFKRATAQNLKMLAFIKDLTDPDVSLIVEKHMYSEKPFCSMCSSMIDKTKNGDGHDDWCLISSALNLINEIEEKQ